MRYPSGTRVGQYAMRMAGSIDEMQAVCDRHGADFVMTPPDAMIGVADNVRSGLLPLNGLRHRPGQTSGWFVWAGEDFDEAPDFFKPLHARHLTGRCPEIVPMLGLRPGWRFLLTPTHEEVWFDPSLLEHAV